MRFKYVHMNALDWRYDVELRVERDRKSIGRSDQKKWRKEAIFCQSQEFKRPSYCSRRLSVVAVWVSDNQMSMLLLILSRDLIIYLTPLVRHLSCCSDNFTYWSDVFVDDFSTSRVWSDVRPPRSYVWDAASKFSQGIGSFEFSWAVSSFRYLFIFYWWCRFFWCNPIVQNN